jgi:hypothetical protein
MMLRRTAQRGFDGLDIACIGAPALWRFLLERVKDVNRPGKAGGLHGPVGIGIEFTQHLEHTSAGTEPWLRRRRQSPALCQIKPPPNVAADFLGHGAHSVPRRANPMQRFPVRCAGRFRHASLYQY